MQALQDYFTDYEAHHQTRWNKAAHSLGLPLIAVALLGLGSKVTLFELPAGLAVDLGTLLGVALVLAYSLLHAGLAAGMAVLLALLYLVGAPIPVAWLWGLLALGVVLLYVGHYVFEGRGPAFHKNAVHMLIGPLWTAALLFKALRVWSPQPPARQ